MIEPTFETRPFKLIIAISITLSLIVYLLERTIYGCGFLCGLYTFGFIVFVVMPFLIISISITFFISYRNYRKKYNIFKEIHKKEMEVFEGGKEQTENKKD